METTPKKVEEIKDLEFYKKNIPEELTTPIIEKFENEEISEEEMLSRLERIFFGRKKIEWKIDNNNNSFNKEVEIFLKRILNSRFNSKNFVGLGNSGIVYVLEDNISVCVKFLHDPSKTKYSISEEFSLLNRAYEASLSFNVLKIPSPHFIVNNLNPDKSIFVMDYIDSISLEDLEKNPDSFFDNFTKEELINALLKFSNPEYEKKLKEDILKLFNAGIIHGDMHFRNVLLGKDLNFYLIDFGNSIDMYKEKESKENQFNNLLNLSLNSISNHLKSVILLLNQYLIKKYNYVNLN